MIRHNTNAFFLYASINLSVDPSLFVFHFISLFCYDFSSVCLSSSSLHLMLFLCPSLRLNNCLHLSLFSPCYPRIVAVNVSVYFLLFFFSLPLSLFPFVCFSIYISIFFSSSFTIFLSFFLFKNFFKKKSTVSNGSQV